MRRGARLRMAGLGALGFVETSYLTIQKIAFGGAPALCGTQGCQEVLSGPFSHVGPVPLTLPGALAYLSIIALALAPLVVPAPEEGDHPLEGVTKVGLFVVSTSMATFSTYLMGVLGFVIGSPCPYCILSAFCSFTLAALSWRGSLLPLQRALKAGAAAAAFTFAATVPMYMTARAETVNLAANPASAYKMGDAARGARQQLAAEEVSDDAAAALELLENAEIDAALKEKRAPKVLTTSGKREMKIAGKLREKGAKFYGAYWCGHCYEQKRRLGAEAMKSVQYFECAKDGQNSQAKICREKGVPGYPTWEIDGELHPGEKSLAELEELLGMM